MSLQRARTAFVPLHLRMPRKAERFPGRFSFSPTRSGPALSPARQGDGQGSRLSGAGAPKGWSRSRGGRERKQRARSPLSGPYQTPCLSQLTGEP